jgi:transketolase
VANTKAKAKPKPKSKRSAPAHGREQAEYASWRAAAERVRRNSVVSVYCAGSGHPGGALSAADLLVAIWKREVPFTRATVSDARRPRFILSKGHACPALYGLAAETGLIEHHQLRTLRKLGSPLQGHPHVLDAPWAETSTGSLGQGFSVSIGIALGLRHTQNPARVYAMLGDGEMQEGEVWEGAMCAAHYKLDNLCIVVDYNKMQSDALNENIMGLEPLGAKWKAFGWHVTEIDGHNFAEIDAALAGARAAKGKPSAIIAHTIKGKGVSYMEGIPKWHGSVKLRTEELELALRDLGVAADDVPAWVDGRIWGNANGR